MSMIFDFYMPVKLFSGTGAFKENCSELKGLGSRCLIVSGGSSALKSGALEDVSGCFSSMGIEFEIFNKIEQNPKTASCKEAGDAAIRFGADFILGIGGGSALDAAKAVAFFARNPDLKHNEIYERFPFIERLPVALIGTTAGTGSEVTAVSVLTDSDNGRKRSICGDNTFADIAFADAKYTFSMPYDVTVSTALDSFAHAVESFLALNRNEMSVLFAEKAIVLIWEALKYFDETALLPSIEMRDKLYLASIYGGLSICITGTLFPHALGYVLSEDFNLPHGKACTAFMGELIDFVMQNAESKKRAEEIFRLCSCDKNEFKRIVEKLTDMDIIMTAEEIDNYCRRWTDETKNFTRTPGQLKMADVKEIFKRLFYR